jgi:hypothetical protein
MVRSNRSISSSNPRTSRLAWLTMLFSLNASGCFCSIKIYFSYLRKIIKIDNRATEGLVQQWLPDWVFGLI